MTLYRTTFLAFLLLLFTFISCVKDLPTQESLIDDIPDTTITSDTSNFSISISNIGYTNDYFVFQGQHVLVPITLNSDRTIGGYDLLVAYNASALSFQSATPGQSLTDNNWEYFTYRYGANGNCETNCPSGLLRLTAIAETNNGPYHPSDGIVSDLAVMDFLVTNDRTYECATLPISFFWMDCGDNAVSDWQGYELFISEKVYHGYDIIADNSTRYVQIEYEEVQNPDTTYPTYLGSQNLDCFDDPNKLPLRELSVYNGSVWIYCDHIIDARGDLNLNSVANEIADAVLFSNYFVYGIGVFTVNTEGQMAASDVNADGYSLSVADLSYLIRIIVGDALPYHKLTQDTVVFSNQDGLLSVDKEMGAVLVVLEGDASFEQLTDSMAIEYLYNGTQTRVLIYSIEGHTFSGEFLSTDADIISIEFGSAEGAMVEVTTIPFDISVGQNNPNPFKDSTLIPFNINLSAEVTLEVYNKFNIQVFTITKTFNAGDNNFIFYANGLQPGEYKYTVSTSGIEESKTMMIVR